jgi:selenide,water dikinase
VRRNRNGGMDSNRGHFGPKVGGGDALDAATLDLLFDPQTSGGLLIAIGAEQAADALAALRAAGVTAVEVGQVLPPGKHLIELR